MPLAQHHSRPAAACAAALSSATPTPAGSSGSSRHTPGFPHPAAGAGAVRGRAQAGAGGDRAGRRGEQAGQGRRGQGRCPHPRDSRGRHSPARPLVRGRLRLLGPKVPARVPSCSLLLSAGCQQGLGRGFRPGAGGRVAEEAGGRARPAYRRPGIPAGQGREDGGLQGEQAGRQRPHLGPLFKTGPRFWPLRRSPSGRRQ